MAETSFPKTHNMPPLDQYLPDQYRDLLNDVEALAARANGSPRVVTSDDELAVVSGVVKAARDLSKTVDAARVSEKEPYLAGGRTVDAFFGESIVRLRRIADTLTDSASEWQRKKLAEERRQREAEAARLREQEEKLRAEAERAARSETAARKNDKADELAAQADAAEAEATKSASELGKVTGDGFKVGAKTEWAFQITDYEAVPLDKLRPYFKRDVIEAAIKSFVKINKGSSSLPGVRVFEDVKASIR